MMKLYRSRVTTHLGLIPLMAQPQPPIFRKKYLQIIFGGPYLRTFGRIELTLVVNAVL